MPARRRRLVLLQLAQELHRPQPGLAHLRGSRHRRRRQHRRDAGELHLDDRHDGSRLGRDLPRLGRRLQLNRLGGHRGHRVRRRRARQGRGLDQARRRQPVLERHRLRRRHRELAPRDRNRVLVARLPDRQLPRRRRLRRPRPRDRHRREPGDAERVLADLRHRGAEHDDHRAAERPDQRDRRLLLLLRDRGRLDVRVPARRRRLVLLHLAEELQRPRARARTPSRCAPPTPPATPTRRRRASRGRSTPPRRTRRSPRSRATRATRTDADFSFTSSEGGSTFECQLDGGGWSACTSPEELHRPERGLAHLRGARDRRRRQHRPDAGDAAPGRSTRPRPTRRSPPQPSDPSNDDRRRASPSAPPRAARRFECQLDGGGCRSCTSPDRATPASPTGSHTFEVRATDAAGNTDPTPAIVHLDDRHGRAETRRSTARPDRPDQRDRRRPSPSPPTEAGSTFECQLDGGGFASCTSPQSYTGLADGSHTFQVRATDAAGNTDPTPATYTWTVDTAAPDTTITAQPDRPEQLDATPTSPSPPARPARPSSASSTAAASRLHLARRATPASPTARTPSRCAPPTPPATPTRRPPRYTWTIDTDRARARRSPRSRPTRRTTPAPSFAFTSDRGAARPSSASSTAAPGRACTLAAELHRPDRRARTPSRCAPPTPPATPTRPRPATPGRSTRPTRAPTIAFPAAAGFYNTATWNDFSGTASDAGGAALDKVEVSIKRDADDQYWNGTAFADGTENWRRRHRDRLVDARVRLGQLPRRRRLHDARSRDRHRRQRPGPADPRVRRRHGRPRDVDHGAAERPDERNGRELLLHGRPARLDLRLQARRRVVRSLHVAEELHGPRRRLAHLPGARNRPGRQPRPDAGELHLDDRPDRSELHAHPAGGHPLQRRRLARLQRNRR